MNGGRSPNDVDAVATLRRVGGQRPDTMSGPDRWDFATVRTATVRGQAFTAGLFSNTGGETVFRLHDAVTGDLLGSTAIDDDWVYPLPDRHLCVTAVDGSAYAVILDKRRCCTVVRLTGGGPVRVGRFPRDAFTVACMADGRVDGRPAVLASDGAVVRAYGVLTGDHHGRPWQAPQGWQVDQLVRAGRRTYAWLSDNDDRCWLWDAVEGSPVGPPMRILGLRWGPWDLSGRPALLMLVRHHRYEVWDLSLGEPVGLPLPMAPHELTAPCVGTLHGRPVLAAATGVQTRVWDLLTGTLIHAGRLVEPPLVLAVTDGRVLTVVDRAAEVASVPIPVHAAHPLSIRSRAVRMDRGPRR